jgi:hypothetical protein
MATNLCFAPLDQAVQAAPNKITILAVARDTPEYPADPLERALDRYCIEGATVNAADLEDSGVDFVPKYSVHII